MPFQMNAGRAQGALTWQALIQCATAGAVVLVQSACGGSGSTNVPVVTPPKCTVTSVAVNATAASVNTGVAVALSATIAAATSCTGGVTWSAAPTGGTLTPNGLNATFTSAAAGTFTITATSTDDATKSASVPLTVTQAGPPPCTGASGTSVTHSTNITANETWAGDGVTHLIPNAITISGAAVVTIQPCAIVALASGVTINVGGTAHFVAAGTAANRSIVFQRSNAAQAWGTIRGVSATSLIDLNWTTLTGGGNFGGIGNPTLTAFGNGYAFVPAPVIRVNNVTITGSVGEGVYLDANAGFTNDSQLLTVKSSGSQPVVTTMMSLGTLPTGTYTGNAIDEILIFGPNANVFSDMTVQDLGVPVRIAYGGMSIAPSPGGAASTVTLTVKPGVIFRFPKLPGPQPGARVTFGTNGNPPNNLVGVLNAVGTAAKPIVFTSGESSPAPGDWVGLWLNTANGSRLDYVVIEYAGGAAGIVSANCRIVNTPDNAALLVGDFSAQYVPPSNLITNSRISNSAGYGISALWQAGVFNSVDLTATNTFTSNARCKQTYNGLQTGTCPPGGGCTAP
jgi:hypothetical protein